MIPFPTGVRVWVAAGNTDMRRGMRGLAAWMNSDLSQRDLWAIQIDGLHVGRDLVLVAALGIDADGNKHPLGLMEGATENAAVVQALIDNLIERGLDPAVCRLFHRRRRQGAEQTDSKSAAARSRRNSRSAGPDLP